MLKDEEKINYSYKKRLCQNMVLSFEKQKPLFYKIQNTEINQLVITFEITSLPRQLLEFNHEMKSDSLKMNSNAKNDKIFETNEIF